MISFIRNTLEIHFVCNAFLRPLLKGSTVFLLDVLNISFVIFVTLSGKKCKLTHSYSKFHNFQERRGILIN